MAEFAEVIERVILCDFNVQFTVESHSKVMVFLYPIIQQLDFLIVYEHA